jgi:hypothetical protein
MRFRAGVIVGFGAGYYLGAKAGREKYEQINKTIRKVKRSDAYVEATDKARAVVDLGTEKVKDVVDEKVGSTNGNGSGESVLPGGVG